MSTTRKREKENEGRNRERRKEIYPTMITKKNSIISDNLQSESGTPRGWETAQVKKRSAGEEKERMGRMRGPHR